MAKSPSKEFDDTIVRTLANLLNETDLTEIEYSLDGLNVRVTRNLTVEAAIPQAAPMSAHAAPVAVPVAEATPDEIDKNHPGILTSPMVGTVYTSPDPDSPTFINLGDSVTEGQTVLLIEAMKVFNPILAHKSGKVTSIFIEGGSPVEFDEPMLLIE